MKEVRLTKDLECNGWLYPPGTVMEFSEKRADWLIAQGCAEPNTIILPPSFDSGRKHGKNRK